MKTIKEAFEEFLPSARRKLTTRNKYRHKLRPFLQQHGSTPIDHITPETIEKWFAQLETKYSQASLSMHRACIVSLFNYCVSQEWLHRNPARNLPRYSSDPPFIKVANENDLDQALTICGFLSHTTNPYHRRNAAIFALGAASAARRGNLMSMPHQETLKALQNPTPNNEVGNIYTVQATGKTKLEIVFGEWQADLLRRYLEVRPPTRHNRLFVNLEPNNGRFGQPLGEQGMNKARWQICHIANIPVITYQEMRRLKGTKIARKYNLELAAQVLGHTNTTTTRKHYYDPDKQAARIATLKEK